MKRFFILLPVILFFSITHAATYTATTSGNWTSSATWTGGTAPGNDISADQVVIPLGVTVTVDHSLYINGVQGSLTVAGNLVFSDESDTLWLGHGDLAGNGDIEAGILMLDSSALVTFTGDINVQTVRTSSTGVQLAANLSVTDTLYISWGTLTFGLGSSLDLEAGATIVIAGGSLAGNTGILSLTGDYNVMYTSTSSTAGLELNGSGLEDVTIDVPDSNTVTLSTNLNVQGTLSLTSGILVLNGHNLTISGNLSGGSQGMIHATTNSNITVATTSSPTGRLNFTDDGHTINNLTINVSGFNGMAMLGTDLKVTGTLAFTSGSLHVSNNTLYIEQGATITGAGASSYVIATDSGMLAMHLTAGAASNTRFPIGTGMHYTPAWIDLNTGSASGMIMASVMDSVRQQGDTGQVMANTHAMVNATWHITSDISSNLDMDLTLLWSAAMEVNGFNRDSAYIAHYTNNNWDTHMSSQATVSGNLYSVTRTGITSLSPFSVFSKDASTGITDASAEVRLAVFPNPANDLLQIETNSKLANGQVDIINLNGEVVKHFSLTGIQTQISLNELSGGTYFMKVYNQQAVATSRFTKL